MYCPKCDRENVEGAVRCAGCGFEFAAHPAIAAPVASTTSQAAVAALVLGILVFFTCGITALPAIICGIVALVKISGSNGLLKGKGMAITGLVLPAVFIIIVPLPLAILLPALSRTKAIVQRVGCETNLRGLSMAMTLYGNDYDDEAPTADEWCDLLIQEVEVSPRSFRCPAAPEGGCNYALNKNFRDMSGPEPARTVAIFESRAGWNQAGGPELLTTEYHDGEGCNVAFGDGHTEFVRSDRLDDLYWGPDE